MKPRRRWKSKLHCIASIVYHNYKCFQICLWGKGRTKKCICPKKVVRWSVVRGPLVRDVWEGGMEVYGQTAAPAESFPPVLGS